MTKLVSCARKCNAAKPRTAIDGAFSCSQVSTCGTFEPFCVCPDQAPESAASDCARFSHLPLRLHAVMQALKEANGVDEQGAVPRFQDSAVHCLLFSYIRLLLVRRTSQHAPLPGLTARSGCRACSPDRHLGCEVRR